ncbi:MAG: hypothetical protein ACREE7_14230 [Dongiaceae bacterium]
MSHVTLAWELGAGYGHLGRLLSVATALNHGSHRVTFIVRDLYRAQIVLDGRGFAILQAPLWLGPATAGRAVPSYAGTVLPFLYDAVAARIRQDNLQYLADDKLRDNLQDVDAAAAGDDR